MILPSPECRYIAFKLNCFKYKKRKTQKTKKNSSREGGWGNCETMIDVSQVSYYGLLVWVRSTDSGVSSRVSLPAKYPIRLHFLKVPGAKCHIQFKCAVNCSGNFIVRIQLSAFRAPGRFAAGGCHNKPLSAFLLYAWCVCTDLTLQCGRTLLIAAAEWFVFKVYGDQFNRTELLWAMSERGRLDFYRGLVSLEKNDVESLKTTIILQQRNAQVI